MLKLGGSERKSDVRTCKVTTPGLGRYLIISFRRMPYTFTHVYGIDLASSS